MFHSCINLPLKPIYTASGTSCSRWLADCLTYVYDLTHKQQKGPAACNKDGRVRARLLLTQPLDYLFFARLLGARRPFDN